MIQLPTLPVGRMSISPNLIQDNMPGQFQAPEVNMADVQINGSDLTIETNQAHICGQGLIEIVLTIL